MDDNARPHRTLAVEELLESEDITGMDWPAYSPDLNPIVHVWNTLGRRIVACLHHPENTQQLKKRKRQFYGNKFTNTSKKNSTSAVPECTASCSKFGKESFSTAEEMPGPVFGNRIVDLELIVEAFAQLCCPKCFAEK
ncbi:transposable element Tc1 transposase [Trichonephila clavipes]|nr:transposable element Tc1 transposase [Trichonephila clavipes]